MFYLYLSVRKLPTARKVVDKPARNETDVLNTKILNTVFLMTNYSSTDCRGFINKFLHKICYFLGFRSKRKL